MRRLAVAAVLLATASCSEVTAAEIAVAHVTLTAKQGSAACVVANPEPASVRVKQGVSFVNNSTVQITIVLTKDNLPLISVAPSDTSGAVKFREPGIYQYYSQGCGSGSSELHTLAVTVN
ncbi:MAG TPA: hypothetical protein VFT29_14355 [Gemmatimonadaceae bacterium]|nr:hypothetical protein [Gemmatimonadaceae bacterium]